MGITPYAELPGVIQFVVSELNVANVSKSIFKPK